MKKRILTTFSIMLLCLLAAFGPSFNTEAAKKVRLNKTSSTVYLNSTRQLKVYGTKKKVTWKSSNTKIAKVSTKGKVTPKKEGTVNIYAKVDGKRYKCKITVKYPLSKKSDTIYMGDEVQLKLRGTDKKVKWSSSNKEVLKVTSKGLISTVKPGKATISATADKKTYKCRYTIKESIILKNYKGLEIRKIIPNEVTDQDITDAIQERASLILEPVEVKDRIAQEGDTVNITYKGTINDKTFKNDLDISSSAKKEDVEIGMGWLPVGIEEGLIGHAAGETFELTATIGKDDLFYSSQKGKKAVYTITIHSVSAIPELTDELYLEIKEDLGAKAATLEEYRAEVRTQLEALEELSASAERVADIEMALAKECQVIHYPKALYQKCKDQFYMSYTLLAMEEDMDINEYVKQELNTTVKKLIQDSVKAELALDYIARKEGLKLTTKQYNQRLNALAAMMGMEDDPEAVESLMALFITMLGGGDVTLRDAFQEAYVCEYLYPFCVEVGDPVTPESDL